jgi:hypothetical protein
MPRSAPLGNNPNDDELIPGGRISCGHSHSGCFLLTRNCAWAGDSGAALNDQSFSFLFSLFMVPYELKVVTRDGRSLHCIANLGKAIEMRAAVAK